MELEILRKSPKPKVCATSSETKFLLPFNPPPDTTPTLEVPAYWCQRVHGACEASCRRRSRAARAFEIAAEGLASRPARSRSAMASAGFLHSNRPRRATHGTIDT